MDPRFFYRETAVQGASPVRLVICLYEQAIEDLRHALAAQQRGDIEGRTRSINHALKVIGQLQGTLDMERGGKVARNLQQFYDVVRNGLIAAQIQQSAKIIQEQISQLTMIHDAWLEVERTTSPLPQFKKPEPESSPAGATSETASAEWEA